MKILIACEYSGKVRDAFKARGHDAWSCDLLPTDVEGQHIQGDVLDVLDQGWDLMIAHPPCTHLAVSGARWFKDKKQEQHEALEFANKLRNAVNALNIEHKASLNADHITISIGIATTQSGKVYAEQALLEEADLGLYAAKDAGRDRIVAR